MFVCMSDRLCILPVTKGKLIGGSIVTDNYERNGAASLSDSIMGTDSVTPVQFNIS